MMRSHEHVVRYASRKRISAILLRNVRRRMLVLKFLLSAYTYEHYIDSLHLRIYRVVSVASYLYYPSLEKFMKILIYNGNSKKARFFINTRRYG